MKNLARVLLGLLVAVFLAQLAYFYPQLPAVVASHFDARGVADGWLSKPAFLVMEFVLLALCLAFALLLPAMMHRLPDSLINLPHKDYWLAPARRDATMQSMSDSFSWLGVGMMALFVGLNQLLFPAQVNRVNPSPLMLWVLIGAYLLFVFLLLFKPIRRFYNVPQKS